MNNIRHTSIDDIALYISRGCELHPHLSTSFDAQLEYMSRMGKISLTPSELLARFHRKLAVAC